MSCVSSQCTMLTLNARRRTRGCAARRDRSLPCHSLRVHRSQNRAVRPDRVKISTSGRFALIVSTSVSGMPAVLFAKMELRRHRRLVVCKAHHGAAVKTDRGLQPCHLGRRRISDAAAEAKANNTNRSAVLCCVDRGLRIAQHRGPVGIGDKLPRHGHFVRRVAGLEVGFDAIKDRRRNGDVARIRQGDRRYGGCASSRRRFPG